MKRDYCHHFWVGSIGISASNYRLSRSSTGRPLPPVIGSEKRTGSAEYPLTLLTKFKTWRSVSRHNSFAQSKSDTHLRAFETYQPATMRDLFRSQASDTRQH